MDQGSWFILADPHNLLISHPKSWRSLWWLVWGCKVLHISCFQLSALSELEHIQGPSKPVQWASGILKGLSHTSTFVRSGSIRTHCLMWQGFIPWLTKPLVSFWPAPVFLSFLLPDSDNLGLASWSLLTTEVTKCKPSTSTGLLLLALCSDMPEEPAPWGVSCIGKHPTVGKTLLSIIFVQFLALPEMPAPWLGSLDTDEQHFTGHSVQ